MLHIPTPPARWEVIIRRSNFVQGYTEKNALGACRHIRRTLDLHVRTGSFGGLWGG